MYKVRKLVWIITCFFALLLTGCSEKELEERCFPMMAAVGYEDNQVTFGLVFPRSKGSGDANSSNNEIQVPMVLTDNFNTSKDKYERHLNKIADYNHLKVFVIEEDLLEESKAYAQMLDSLSAEEELPRNTYVCVVEDIEELMELESNLPQDLGSYLEEYLTNHEEKKDRLLTLGDLIDEKENEEMVLYLPYLDIEENYVEWEGYVNTKGKIWKEF